MAQQLEFRWESSAAPAPPKPAAGEAVPVAPAPAADKAMEEQARLLHAELKSHCAMKLDLKITDNTSTILSLKHDQHGMPRLHLHHMFLTAPPEVRHALGEWIKKPRAKKSGEILDQFIRDRKHQIRTGKRRRTRIRTAGKHFDLQQLYDEVNKKYLNGAVSAPITWGRMPAANRRRHSIRFGSYCTEDLLIRIHPLLDSEEVPRYFIRYIVFHEMLHALLGVKERPSGRRDVHPKRFKCIERSFPDYERAVKWMETPRNLRRMLRRTK